MSVALLNPRTNIWLQHVDAEVVFVGTVFMKVTFRRLMTWFDGLHMESHSSICPMFHILPMMLLMYK